MEEEEEEHVRGRVGGTLGEERLEEDASLEELGEEVEKRMGLPSDTSHQQQETGPGVGVDVVEGGGGEVEQQQQQECHEEQQLEQQEEQQKEDQQLHERQQEEKQRLEQLQQKQEEEEKQQLLELHQGEELEKEEDGDGGDEEEGVASEEKEEEVRPGSEMHNVLMSESSNENMCRTSSNPNSESSVDSLLADKSYFLHVRVSHKSCAAYTYTPLNRPVGIDIPSRTFYTSQRSFVQQVRTVFCFTIAEQRFVMCVCVCVCVRVIAVSPGPHIS